MTRNEKANDLFTTFRYALSHKDAPFGMYKDNMAIQCALIAVEELIECTKNGLGTTKFSKEYWQQVKYELQSFQKPPNP